MILRHIADAIRTQNWFTVIVEILIVVIGIFLGLQVTDWNDSRKDRALEREYLTRIAADLDQSAEIFERMRSLATTRVEATNYLFSTIADPAAGQAQPCKFLDAAWHSFIANYPSPLRQTYDEMIASGGLSLVHSNEVKKALSTYYTRFDDGEDRTDDYQMVLRNYIKSVRLIMPADLGLAINKKFISALASGQGLSRQGRYLETCNQHIEQVLAMHRAYVVDPQIASFLQSVDGLHRAQELIYANLLQANRQVRALIAAKLGETGVPNGEAP